MKRLDTPFEPDDDIIVVTARVTGPRGSALARLVLDTRAAMTTLTPELRRAVEQAGDQPVEITDPHTNTSYVLVKANIFARMKEELEEEENRREKDAWTNLGRKARSEWAKENPY